MWTPRCSNKSADLQANYTMDAKKPWTVHHVDLNIGNLQATSSYTVTVVADRVSVPQQPGLSVNILLMNMGPTIAL